MNIPYNYNPAPTGYQSSTGGIPGQVGMPPSIFDQLNANVPDYGQMTQTATGDIQSMLSGQLSPGTTSNIWNQAAARGVNLGQPNSPLSNLIGLNLTGNTSEGLMQQGVGDYGRLTAELGSIQNNPALMAEIASHNATLAAAPNPRDAALFNLALLTQEHSNFSPDSTQTNLANDISDVSSIVGIAGSLLSSVSGMGGGGKSGGGGGGGGGFSAGPSMSSFGSPYESGGNDPYLGLLSQYYGSGA